MLVKRIAAAAVGTALLLTVAAPAFAEMPASATGSRQKAVMMCERISRLSDDIQARLEDGRTKLLARRDERTERLTQHRADLDSRLVDRREKWEGHWDDLIGRLEASSATNTAAIAAFKTAMEAAWKTRNVSVDAARKAFRDGLDKLLADKKAAVENASLAFRASAAAAFAKAKTDCDSGVSPEMVMTNLRTALKTAQEKFNADRKSIDKIGEKVKALVQVRQAAVAKAVDDFRAAVEKAKTDLKRALKV